MRSETVESAPTGDFSVPEDEQKGEVVLKDVYDLKKRIKVGEGEVSAEEYHSVFDRALSRIKDDHSQGRSTQEQLIDELSGLSRLQNEVGAMVFQRLKSARIDQLTNLPTADFFNIQVQEMLDKQREYVRDEEAEFLTIAILIDVNELKPINDQIGHKAGNVALREVARVIMAKLREGDPIQYRGHAAAGRIGGDEFVVVIDRVFSKTDDSTTISEFVDKTIERFRRDFSMIDFKYQDETYSVSATVGFAYTTEFVDTGPEKLLEMADKDMYFHKPKNR